VSQVITIAEIENKKSVGERSRAKDPRELSLRDELRELYQRVRHQTEELCETLVAEDCVIQTVPEVSPTKWHLAHTTWFFENFLLQAHVPDYRSMHPQYGFLFNSYYNAAGKMHARPQRGLISRPTLKETFDFRKHVDSRVQDCLENCNEEELRRLAPLIVLGVNHEQQHQELILTDIKHVFSMNPLRPAFRGQKRTGPAGSDGVRWQDYSEGIYSIGHEGSGFHFDNEGPRHRVFLAPFSLASRLVTNQEYLAFINEGGYRRPEFWLSLGWIAINEKGWTAPLYWENRDGHWWQMTLAGLREVDSNEPVCHISYFEADAYARWAGARLPSEDEWEVASEGAPLQGNFLESGYFHPAPLASHDAHGALCQMFGDVWQWTRSAYSPYPGYEPVSGALGEYNGKFMCNQYVLRGASCATPRSHARRTYRNFFPPEARWQFTGIRLARDAHAS